VDLEEGQETCFHSRVGYPSGVAVSKCLPFRDCVGDAILVDKSSDEFKARKIQKN